MNNENGIWAIKLIGLEESFKQDKKMSIENFIGYIFNGFKTVICPHVYNFVNIKSEAFDQNDALKREIACYGHSQVPIELGRVDQETNIISIDTEAIKHFILYICNMEEDIMKQRNITDSDLMSFYMTHVIIHELFHVEQEMDKYKHSETLFNHCVEQPVYTLTYKFMLMNAPQLSDLLEIDYGIFLEMVSRLRHGDDNTLSFYANRFENTINKVIQ